MVICCNAESKEKKKLFSYWFLHKLIKFFFFSSLIFKSGPFLLCLKSISKLIVERFEPARFRMVD